MAGSLGDFVELALLVAGVAVLVIGYRRNDRNLLLAAAILLLLAGALGGMVEGFLEGWRQTAG
ncbi:hypothetical protein H9L17_12765 [Thermomonas brevis]|uniref:Uncharacterized protein n=1 Tax=Thermomonas brevis TaxID=215691 RepID=A0A7G9QXZ9_9GAMM|nr:hypothetical protein H9L17_12765 [Thermomonas brevis]